jgi:hypothetical protein
VFGCAQCDWVLKKGVLVLKAFYVNYRVIGIGEIFQKKMLKRGDKCLANLLLLVAIQAGFLINICQNGVVVVI